MDVRSAPGSGRHPHFRREEMELWLPKAGIAYRWERELGGWRRPSADSANLALRHPAFRGYADHMRTRGFWAALDRVLEEASGPPTAVMCAESLWWRCHRRLLADAAVLARGVEVRHLLHDGGWQPHTPTQGVRVDPEGLLVYDVGQASTLPGVG